MELELEDQEDRSKCSKCLEKFRKVLTFLLSHIGLISLVVGYCIMGAFTFEALESSHELQVKRNMTQVRQAVTQYLWTMTKNTHLIREEIWLQNTTYRLQEFETDLLRGGWDGSENLSTQQWTFSGALFYSIVVVTTIGYGHLTPKTVFGKVVTIFYAIIGIPLMLLCLSHIGDFMASSFRVIYWKVCCYMCTRRKSPRTMRRYQGSTFRRGRSLRSNNPSRPGGGSTRGMKRSASAALRSARTSQRSEDSAYSADSAIFTLPDPGIRRVHSDDHLRAALPMRRMKDSPPLHLRPDSYKNIQKRSTRSAEPAFGSKRNLSILCNRYAEDVITDEAQIVRAPQHVRVRQLRSPERFAYSDYWEDEADEYIYGSDDEDNADVRKKPVPIWLCVLLVLSYIIFGAFLFSNWEGWKFLDSAYFCFVTLTTIGFGDFVPAQRVKNDSSEVSIALCSLYLLFGISLLAMSFNLVQEEVISSVKLVATRLGIIREEED
ncbi:TWiK family of potassium channels protein 7 isoform X2 [Folsomia candida]|uniref:TWiK family of potassium channels protein 7 isoform X2 n=1 Tax=Folsomia candida TaxID=158441 RepID=UPI001605142E|nr:TWiK family of potassium channels protein 7 isoform X2 [Folsomia candida]